MAEDKKLNQSMERFTDMQRDHVHKKHEVCFLLIISLTVCVLLVLRFVYVPLKVK